jgi:membrane protein YdbS with pleckstrin-like domain
VGEHGDEYARPTFVGTLARAMATLRRALPLLLVVSYFAFAAFWCVLIFDENSVWVGILGAIGLPGAFTDIIITNRRRWRRWREGRAAQA